MRAVKTAIGLMSGTSMDGIDAVLLRSDGQSNIDIIGHFSYPYEDAFRHRLKATLDEVSDIETRAALSGNIVNIGRELTYKHVIVVKELLSKYAIKPQLVDLIGFHGQTILHKPDIGLTIQIGDGKLLAKETGIDVVFDLRANDMKHGGQGAPLVPVYHQALAGQLKDSLVFPVAFINIGGISNLTYIDDNVLYAFDCGPGNALIDQWMFYKTQQPFDRNGSAGLQGKIIEPIVDFYCGQPFFQQQKPVSLDWRSFKPLTDKNISVSDGAATLSFISAFAIVNSFRHLPSFPKTLILCGGGAYNQAIIKYLKQLVRSYKIVTLTAQSLGFHSDYIEAEAWAYLAIRSFYGLPITFPTTTGCRSPVTGGKLVKHDVA